jgi:hypothetical protein
VSFLKWVKIAFGLYVLCFSGVRLFATSVEPPSFDDLVERAETIFEGRVIHVESKWTGDLADPIIETFYTFKVLETLKGPASGTYTLQVLGGTIGDETLEVEGAPSFEMGEKSLLFVTNNGRQFVPLVGIMYGHYQIKKEQASNERQIMKHDGKPLPDVSQIGKEDPAVAGGRIGRLRAEQRVERGLSVHAFKDQIRAKLNELKSKSSK